MTNREWLQTLTDEELAKWHVEIGCGSCVYNPERGFCDILNGANALINEDSCIDGTAQWLKQEYKEG